MRVKNMKQGTKQILLTLLLGLAIPNILYGFLPKGTIKQTDEPTTVQTQPSEPQTTSQDKQTYLKILMQDGSLQRMELEEYVVSVVLGEMPAEFELEALKAQAVVARTYAMKRATSADKHSENVVCADSACCQAFCSAEAYLQRGETREMLDKVISAVEQTAGQVLTYNSALIEATYFSCSGGRTEDALAVWGTDIPYLQAVVSPGEEKATYYTDTVTFSVQELENTLDTRLVGNWLGDITYTQGGGVETIELGEKIFQGTQLRSLLGLRSTSFVITVVADTVSITTKGFGHRVGMSQYGAEAMAVDGNTYDQILAYYYRGTALQSLYA